MIGKLMISKLSRSLFLVAAMVTGLVASPQLSEAHSLPARAGSSAYFSDAVCWSPYGPAMTNTCASARYWYIPLFDAGNQWVTITAQGANNNSNVSCGATGWDKNGNYYYGSGWSNLSVFGPATDIVLSLYVPSWGTGEVDCLVYPGGKVITANW
jgi:hypothetical protein